MAHSAFKHAARMALASAPIAVLVAACGGGGEVVALQVITPLNGSWSGFNFGPWLYSPDDYMFVSKLDLRLVVRQIGVCGVTSTSGEAATEGVVDNGKLIVYLPGETSPCLTGDFVDLRRLDLVPAGSTQTISAFNFTVDVQMGRGLWESESGSLILKFTGPATIDNDKNPIAVAGCEVLNPTTKINFTGFMRPFNTTTLARPTIPELRDSGNNLVFSQVEYVDGGTIKLLDAKLNPVTLRRKRDPANTTCPP